MFKNIFIVLLLGLLLWTSKDYLILPIGEKLSSLSQVNSIPVQNINTRKVILDQNSTQKDNKLSLYLKNTLFYEALAFYLATPSPTNLQYIVTYLQALSRHNSDLAIEYIQAFLENEPNATLFTLMITLYEKQGEVSKAIEAIRQAREKLNNPKDIKDLSYKLQTVAQKYIEVLNEKESYVLLIYFLEEMVNTEEDNSFYRYTLAKLYLKLEREEEAKELLLRLKVDENYTKDVSQLLIGLGEGEKSEKAYRYAIPLERYGDHYILSVRLEGIAFRLLLDTGATYIFLDEEKATMFEILQEDLTLQTASTDISAKLCNVGSLEVGDLKLSNVQVTVAPFVREGVDGLLGMNFFKQFSFFIDQKENMLYLNNK